MIPYSPCFRESLRCVCSHDTFKDLNKKQLKCLPIVVRVINAHLQPRKQHLHVKLLLQCHPIIFMLLLSRHTKLLHFSKLLLYTAHPHISQMSRRSGSTHCQRSKLLSERDEGTIILLKEKFSQWYIKALDLGRKDCLSVKYVIVFQAWSGSREQENTTWMANFDFEV